jgi:hypothetical protein
MRGGGTLGSFTLEETKNQLYNRLEDTVDGFKKEELDWHLKPEMKSDQKGASMVPVGTVYVKRVYLKFSNGKVVEFTTKHPEGLFYGLPSSWRGYTKYSLYGVNNSNIEENRSRNSRRTITTLGSFVDNIPVGDFGNYYGND